MVTLGGGGGAMRGAGSLLMAELAGATAVVGGKQQLAVRPGAAWVAGEHVGRHPGADNQGFASSQAYWVRETGRGQGRRNADAQLQQLCLLAPCCCDWREMRSSVTGRFITCCGVGGGGGVALCSRGLTCSEGIGQSLQ